MVQKPFTIASSEILDSMDVDPNLGHSLDQVQLLLKKHGYNQIPQYKPKSRGRILVDQLLDPIVYILAAAALLAFGFSDIMEALAIVSVLLISISIGFFMELKAVRSLEALRKLGQVKTTVVRSGKNQVVRAAELVPGDIICLRRGDVVPADGRLFSVDNLSIKESALTGESIPVFKEDGILPANTSLTERSNMIYRGTTVLTGFGKAIITATGKNTELGRIQQMGVNADKERTPLETKLNQLGKRLIWLTLILTFLIVLIGCFRGKEFLFMIETGVALAVASIPEGLPIVATIALAQGMYRLSKKDVIIKKLEAVQTLGATDVIFTDKTGTLTEDKMNVHILASSKGEESDMGGDDFKVRVKHDPVLHRIIQASVLCNDIDVHMDNPTGDSIEMALIDFARGLAYDVNAVKDEYPEYLELPFNANRKLMATVHHKDGFVVYAKGAFESLIPHCRYYQDNDQRKPFDTTEEWYTKIDSLAAQGLRILAFAYKETEKAPTEEDVLDQLVFLGFIGFLDPARKDVKATLDVYKKAGIKVVMVTGDHPSTSKKIAQEVGMLEANASPAKIIRGNNIGLEDSRNKEGVQRLLNATIFARVSPEQKLNLVSLYQQNGHIVGMIGDGINDVPALKKADIGIAMGIRGTEAAREVADVILKNDKFTAIELAIKQGRVIFQNIRQFVVYLLSCNLAEILSVGFAALLNLPSPLLPLQILFLNLVTDIFPALALGLGKGESDIMDQPPNNPKAPIINSFQWRAIIFYGISICVSVLGVVIYAHFVLRLEPIVINNMAFYTLVLAQLLNVFNMPKSNESFFVNEVTRNPWVWGAILLSLAITGLAYLITPIAEALSLEDLSGRSFAIVLVFALGSLLFAQLLKRLLASNHRVKIS